MSASIVGMVLDRYPGKPHLKCTLLAIADGADSQSGVCNPSYERLAGQTNTNRRTAIRNVQALIDEGIIQLVDHGGFRNDPETGRQVFVSNAYRVNLEMLAVMPTWKMRVRHTAKKPPRQLASKRSHGDMRDTVKAASKAQSTADLRVCGQVPAHGDMRDTVCASPVTPCSSDTGDTLTKTLEPNPEGQGLGDGTCGQVAADRAARAAERRHAGRVAREGLVSHLAHRPARAERAS